MSKRGRRFESTARVLIADGTVRAPTQEERKALALTDSIDRTYDSTYQAQPKEPEYPASWSKGQLLNVRNVGSHYNVTLLGEEFDPRHPERCKQFPSSWECQDFVSWWYARESHDPRAR